MEEQKNKVKYLASHFKKISHLLRPQIEIGGLEMSDGGVSYLSVHPETKRVIKTSIKLNPGIIYKGRVKNTTELVSNLKKLHKQITSKENKSIPIVVSISDENVYTQVFSLPAFENKALDEAIRLNLQVVSPIEFSKTYSDWERIDKGDDGGLEVEILASFIEKEIADPFFLALSQANFLTIAIEQKASSLSRVIREISLNFDPNQSYCILNISGDGLSFSILRNKSMYFNRFSSWENITSSGSNKQINFIDFKNAIIQETHRVTNFFTSKFQNNISSIYLIAPGLDNQVKQVLEQNFQMKVLAVELKDYIIDQNFLVSLGGSLRGFIPRSQDSEISLAPEGTEKEFSHSQVLSFVSIWREIIISTCIVIFISFLGLYLFLGGVIKSEETALKDISANQNKNLLLDLKAKADKFNKMVSIIEKAKGQRTLWSPLIDSIYQKAGIGVQIDRISVQAIDRPVLINARATNESVAVNFKNALQTMPQIANIDLPLSGITPYNANSVSFGLSFEIKNLNF